MFFVGVLLLALGLLTDILNLYFGSRRLRGDGPSGLPIIGLSSFWSGLAVLRYFDGASPQATLTVGKWYLAAHLMLNYGILLVVDVVLRVRGK